MLTKTQRVVMYVLGIVSLALAILACIPFRTLGFMNAENVLSIEGIMKFIVFPVIAVGLSIYPNSLKYEEIKNKCERSKAINVLSYLPILTYLVGLLVFTIHTLMFDQNPFVNEVSHYVLLGLNTAYLVCAVFVIFVINKLTMSLTKKGNKLLDLVFGVAFIILILLSWRITSTYKVFGIADGYIYEEAYKEIFDNNTVSNSSLFVIYILMVFAAIFYCIKLDRVIYADETLIYTGKVSEEERDEEISNIYDDAYNDILDEFEVYFAEEELPEETEEVEETEEAPAEEEPVEEVEETEEEPTEEAPAEEEPAEEAPAEEEPVEEVEEEPAEEVEETPAEEESAEEAPTEEESDEEIDSVESINELNKLIVETDSMNDKEVSEKVEQLKSEIATAKEQLDTEREQLDAERAEHAAKLAELQAKVAEFETPAEEEVVEEEKVKKVLKPSFDEMYEFALSLKDDDVKISGSIDEETKTGTVKFTKNRVQFLIMQATTNDYRITFMASESKINGYLKDTSKRFSIPKNAKTPNMIKFVNKNKVEKGVVKGCIKEAYKGLAEELQRIEEEKARAKAEKKAAKAAAKEAAKAEAPASAE